MKELGSEFWSGCTPLDGSGIDAFLPSGFCTHLVLSGRTGIDLIAQDIKKYNSDLKKVYMPSYCCDTMIEPFIKHGFEIIYYNISFNNGHINRLFNEQNSCDIIFLMDLFGFVSNDTETIARNQRLRNKIVIYDATHSFFCNNINYQLYDYAFGSFRKWFSVNAGFCSKNGEWIDFPLLTPCDEYTNLRNSCFDAKASYMKSKIENKKIFLSGFIKAEDYLYCHYVNHSPDSRSISILKSVNIDFIKNKRQNNAKNIIYGLFSIKHIHLPYSEIRDEDCPLFVPLIVDNKLRTKLRNGLIDKQCYLPIHWPVSTIHNINIFQQELYSSELSCVCDQRYGEAEMVYLTRIIKNLINQYND